ncbi:MAG: GGDEF domain-containing protein [Candidatus Omnitrophica bacterium]|nr:GGDEF domain-containing protein [Candidatus Omnitrophota bacterium]
MLEELANAKLDFLTKCYLKEALTPLFYRLKADYKASNKPWSILLLDIDHFKSFNDKYGHLSGDEVLKYFASSLRLGLEGLDCAIVRFGGDEFVIVFPDKRSKEVGVIAGMLQKNIRNREFLLKGRLFKMSFSGGVATCPDNGETMDDLLAKADKAMYVAKKHGRGRSITYNGIVISNLRRFLLVTCLLGLVGVVALSGARLFSGYFTLNIKSAQVTLTPVEDPNASTVYLKSGAMYKGEIIRETDDAIVLKVRIDKGEALMAIKKSEIKKIDLGAGAAPAPKEEAE